MAKLTRRTFLTCASMGVAAGAVTGGLTALPLVGDAPLRPEDVPGATAGEPVDDLIVHVRNVSTGEIALMVDTREVVHRDPSLAARLMHVARKSGDR